MSYVLGVSGRTVFSEGNGSAGRGKRNPARRRVPGGRRLGFEPLESRQLLSAVAGADVFAKYGGIDKFAALVRSQGLAAEARFWSDPAVQAAAAAAIKTEAALAVPDISSLPGNSSGGDGGLAPPPATTDPAPADTLTYSFQAVAKAKPDQWYTGLGGPYVPISSKPPAGAIPKVNQDYLWGMTQAGDYLWFGTSGNVLCQASGAIGGAGGTARANAVHAAEFGASQYPGVPSVLKSYLGDWRPPQIHKYNMKKGKDEDVTPRDSLLNTTLGLRSAGATQDVVLLAGPDIYTLGLNVFAFNAKTGKYLGSKHLVQYNDIRSWVNVNGVLYTGVLNTFSTQGTGSILRYTGTAKSPFQFQLVGMTDAEPAYLAAHNGRLFVSTWPEGYGSIMGLLGFRSAAKAGIYMSPVISSGGLTIFNALGNQWQKVWSIDEYDPDPVISKSVGGGAMASFDGYLYWGTMQVPGTGAVVFQEAYPQYDATQSGDISSLTFRPGVLFRCADFDKSTHTPASVELLYGASALAKYTPPVNWSIQSASNWSYGLTLDGKPKFGASGFGNLGNSYIWSMTVHDNRLYVGTFDVGTLGLGDKYVELGGNTKAVDQWAHDNLKWDGGMGADLWSFSTDETQAAVLVDKNGVGNPLNHGVRNLLSTPYGLFIGTANSSNLLTNPHDNPLKAGGWELVRVGITAPQVTTSVTTAVQPPPANATGASSSQAALQAAVLADAAAQQSSVARRDRIFGDPEWLGALPPTSP